MMVERRHEMGIGGECICPKCETRMSHERGTPCQELRCPSCGAKMLRMGSQHYEQWRAKRDRKTQK